MSTLLSTNKLVYGSPSKTTTYKVERFNTDSYSVRAAVGINPAQTEYDLKWGGLTLAEMVALVNQIDGTRGITTVTWQPPGAVAAQKFTIASHSVSEYPGPTPYYSVEAKLTREYDL